MARGRKHGHVPPGLRDEGCRGHATEARDLHEQLELGLIGLQLAVELLVELLQRALALLEPVELKAQEVALMRLEVALEGLDERRDLPTQRTL
jgi:hypothetical protein